MSGPLKAVILDNDETTGAYTLLYSIIKTLNKIGDIDTMFYTYIIERLALWMVKMSIFRPGLVPFLTLLMNLRNEGKIDAIIMYTNQLEIQPTLQYSLPRCINHMFTYLVPGFKFDHILTRPEDPTTVNNVFPKKFKRVLDLYPDRPLNTRKMLFFDDLAVPKYITTEGIEPKYTSRRSYVLVEPYKVLLFSEDIESCVRFCFEDFVDIESLTMVITRYYSENIYKDYTPSICSEDFTYFMKLVKWKYNSDGTSKKHAGTTRGESTNLEEDSGPGDKEDGPIIHGTEQGV
jgi:hypothetical protein